LPSAWDNRDHINRLLADRVEISQENADQIARYISSRSAVSGAAAA
jgi:plasmid maintenance system antidote protein VapI